MKPLSSLDIASTVFMRIDFAAREGRHLASAPRLGVRSMAPGGRCRRPPLSFSFAKGNRRHLHDTKFEIISFCSPMYRCGGGRRVHVCDPARVCISRRGNRGVPSLCLHRQSLGERHGTARMDRRGRDPSTDSPRERRRFERNHGRAGLYRGDRVHAWFVHGDVVYVRAGMHHATRMHRRPELHAGHCVYARQWLHAGRGLHAGPGMHDRPVVHARRELHVRTVCLHGRRELHAGRLHELHELHERGKLHVREQRLHAGELVHAGTVLYVGSGVLHLGQPVYDRPRGLHLRPGLHRWHAVHRRSGWLHDGPELHEW